MTRIVGVASGKGGAGKTSVTVGLAFALARAGKRVCILDADLGLANVDILLGLSPSLTLEDVLFENVPLERALVPAGPGVDVIPGSSGVSRMADLTRAARLRLAREFHKLSGHDYLLVDTSPGISGQVVSLCLACPDLVVVVNPEATSITDGYAMVKVLKEQGLTRPPMLLVNRSRDEALGRAVFERVKAAAQKYLKLNLVSLGQVPWDETLSLAAARQRPVLETAPASPASLAFLRAARVLSGLDSPSEAPHRFFDAAVVRAMQQPRAGAKAPAAAPPDPLAAAGAVRDLDAAIALLDGAEDLADPAERAGRLATARLGLRRLRDRIRGVAGDAARPPAPRGRAVVVSPNRSMAEVLTEVVEAAGLVVAQPPGGVRRGPDGRVLGLVYFDGAPGELAGVLAGAGGGPVVLVTPRGHLQAPPEGSGVAELVEAPFRMETLFSAIRRHVPSAVREV
jgi:flagellar biosynthesis protein FlhG